MKKYNWNKIFKKEKKKKYFIKIKNFLKKEYKKKNIYPKYKNIFKAFKITPFENIKVVIIGQDPYYKENQADGLAFSLLPKTKITPTLNNIYKKIKFEYPQFKIPTNGSLNKWAKQGILLLNSILTVEKNKPCSHKNIGWEIFTNKIIKYINNYLKKIIFILWGEFAKKKNKIIDKKKHLILTSSHPSPFSAKINFWKYNFFKNTNYYLKKNKKKEIIW